MLERQQIDPKIELVKEMNKETQLLQDQKKEDISQDLKVGLPSQERKLEALGSPSQDRKVEVPSQDCKIQKPEEKSEMSLSDPKELKNKIAHSPFILLSKASLKSPFTGENIKYPDSFVLNYLSTKEVLNYREVSKAALEETKKVVGPYYSFAEFVIATSGSFCIKKTGKLKKDNKRFKKRKSRARCINGWEVYVKTIRYMKYKGVLGSMDAAVLYKSRNFKGNILDRVIENVSEGDDMHTLGRVYTPGKKGHSIPVNESWQVAQFHLGRPFIALSQIHVKNLHREEYPSEFSAFSRELASLYKAGYSLTGLNYQDYPIFYPTRLTPQAIKQLTIQDIRANDDEIETAFDIFSKQYAILYRVTTIIESLKETIEEFEDSYVDEQDKVARNKQQYLQDVKKYLKQILLDEKTQEIFACEQFIKMFNATPEMGVKIRIPSSNGTLFDKNNLFPIIKETVLTLIGSKIDEAVERMRLAKEGSQVRM
jgi:hypothetical protein